MTLSLSGGSTRNAYPNDTPMKRVARCQVSSGLFDQAGLPRLPHSYCNSKERYGEEARWMRELDSHQR